MVATELAASVCFLPPSFLRAYRCNVFFPSSALCDALYRGSPWQWVTLLSMVKQWRSKMSEWTRSQFVLSQQFAGFFVAPGPVIIPKVGFSQRTAASSQSFWQCSFSLGYVNAEEQSAFQILRGSLPWGAVLSFQWPVRRRSVRVNLAHMLWRHSWETLQP